MGQTRAQNGVWHASMQSLQVTSAIKNPHSSIINQITPHATVTAHEILDRIAWCGRLWRERRKHGKGHPPYGPHQGQ